MEIRKLSEQAVSEGSGGEKILWLLAYEVTKLSKENGAGESKKKYCIIQPLGLSRKKDFISMESWLAQ